MKRLLFINFVVFLVFGCKSNFKLRDSNNLEIRIKKTKEITYSVKELKGELIKGELLGINKSPIVETHRSYYKDCELKEIIHFNKTGEIIQRRTRSISEIDGIRIEETFDSVGRLISKTHTINDEAGNILIMLHNSKSSPIVSYYEYDGRNNIITERTSKLNPDYNLSTPQFIRYRYDLNNNLVEMKYVSKDKKSRSGEKTYMQTTYKYDENDLLVEENEISTLDSLYYSLKTIYKYNDEQDNIEEIDYGVNGKLESKTTYKYDRNKNVVERIGYSFVNEPNQSKINRFYKYDNKNNWVEKIVLLNEIPEYLIERKIEYY